jgi:hypothetical protein
MLPGYAGGDPSSFAAQRRSENQGETNARQRASKAFRRLPPARIGYGLPPERLHARRPLYAGVCQGRRAVAPLGHSNHDRCPRQCPCQASQWQRPDRVGGCGRSSLQSACGALVRRGTLLRPDRLRARGRPHPCQRPASQCHRDRWRPWPHGGGQSRRSRRRCSIDRIQHSTAA